MNTKSLIINIVLLLLLAMCQVAWADDERKLVIEPRLPNSSEFITISVTNSGCHTLSDVLVPDEDTPRIQIRLTFLTGPYGECLQQNPSPPDFEVTVGPLQVGEYNVSLFINTGAHGSNIVDVQQISVIEAVETGAVAEGGINGLYHDLQAPHRYFYVLETDYTTLVVWNFFDIDGNQAWVYGVGDLLNEGSTVVAEAYLNTSGGFLPNGEADDAVEPWGLIRLDMHSCLEGTVTYESDLPEFGNGQFEVSRLAYSKHVGCSESE